MHHGLAVDDKVIPPAYAAIWRDHRQHAETKTIPDAGHLVNLEQPNRFATIAGGWFMQG